MRVHSRGANMWFLFSALLFVMTVMAIVFARGGPNWIAVGIVAGLSIASLLWGLFGARQYIDFGNEVTVAYLCRERIIPWNEVAGVSFSNAKTKLRTGVPLVSIPVENDQLELTLKTGDVITFDINPAQKMEVAQFVETKISSGATDGPAAKSRKEGSSDFGLRIGFSLALVGLSIFFTKLMLPEIVDGRASTDWPTTEGTLKYARIKSETSTGRRGREVISYSPIVEYTYTVADQRYTGTMYRFSPVKSTSREDISKLLGDMPDGKAIPVHYNPQAPATSVLIAGVSGDRFVFLVAVILIGLGALGYAVVNIFQLMRSRQVAN